MRDGEQETLDVRFVRQQVEGDSGADDFLHIRSYDRDLYHYP